MHAANLNVYNTRDVASYYAAMSFISPCERLLFDKYISPGLSLLDLGVGGGRTTAYLAPRSSHYVGVDYAPEMIRVCEGKFPDLEFRQADASDLSSFASASFDVVLMSFNGIDSLLRDGRDRCVQECFRVLKPKGIFVFSSHNVRAILVAPAWSAERVRDVANRLSRGNWLQYPLTALLTGAAALRAFARAIWASAPRCRRMTTAAFWHGDGYLHDPAHGGILQRYSVPKRVIAEVVRHGFQFLERQGSEYPAARGVLFTKWYYYAFRKP